MNKLTFHQKGVQSMIFANKGQTLISIGVAEENTLVVWDIHMGLVLGSTLIRSHATNQLVIDPVHKDQLTDCIEFCTVGTKGHFTFWRYVADIQDIQLSVVRTDSYPSLRDTDFVTACYS